MSVVANIALNPGKSMPEKEREINGLFVTESKAKEQNGGRAYAQDNK